MKKYFYFNNCVSWESQDVFRAGGLSDMIDRNLEITRKTFLKHVDRDSLLEIEHALGYGPGTGFRSMSSDWAVSYHRSRLHRRTVYYFRHSAIEYIFTEDWT